MELNDVGLRHLLCDVHELDREQIRLSNNRRKLLEFAFGFKLSFYMRLNENLQDNWEKIDYALLKGLHVF